MISFKQVSYTYPFQEHPVLRNINFELNKGEAILITGPSGCGKSTLLRILNGLIPNHFKGELQGAVQLDGLNLPVPLDEVSQRVGVVLQNPDEQFMATCVADEVALALEWQQIPAEEIRRRVDEALAALKIESIAEQSVFTLSQGEKQKTVLAALLACKPSVVVMDEPTANLSPEATEELREICLMLKKQGITLVIVDHRLYWLRGVLDRMLVLQDGAPVFQSDAGAGDPLDQLAAHPELKAWGLRDVHVERPELKSNTEAEDFLIDVDRISFRYPRTKKQIYSNWSMQLPSGAVTAVVGGNGAGKTTLARLLTGLNKPQSGTLLFDGKPLKPRTIRARTAFVMQQMEIQLYMRTVKDELLFSDPKKRVGNARSETAEKWIRVFGLTGLEARHPQSLSGGERQRLVIACALMKEPDLLILDEPTSGLDGLNMQIIADQISAFTRQGGTVLLITHDLELLQKTAAYKLTIGD
ncbi:MAG: ABC transporter ATP-binding protein [Pontiella sp.]